MKGNSFSETGGTTYIDSEEYLLSSIAYVLRNPFSTGSRCLPFHYEWCSAGLYFRAGQKHRTAGEKQLADLPGYIMERRLQMRRIMLPGHYVINDEDMIVPECYVEIPAVEKVFASPKRFLYHMSRNLDREMKLSMGASGKISFDDREMKTAMLQICSAEFNADSPDSLHIASHPLTQPCLNISGDTPRAHCRSRPSCRQLHGPLFREHTPESLLNIADRQI